MWEYSTRFFAGRSEVVTLVSEVFPQQAQTWHMSESEGQRNAPVSRLRLSSDSHALEINFGNLKAAQAVADAIMEMIDDGIEALKPHSDLNPRIRVHVVRPPAEPWSAS